MAHLPHCEELFRDLSDKLTSWICSKGLEKENAFDISQQSLMETWERILNEPSDEMSDEMITRIAFKRAKWRMSGFWRKQKASPVIRLSGEDQIQDFPTESETDPTIAADVRKRAREAFTDAFETLTDNNQKALLLYLQGYSHIEIGAKLGISQGASSMHLTRTKNHITDLLVDLCEEDMSILIDAFDEVLAEYAYMCPSTDAD